MKLHWYGSLIRAALLLSCLTFAGCEAQVVPQSVIVNLDEVQVGIDELRLYASTECAGEYEVHKRDSKAYSFSTHSMKGGFGEVTQELALCVTRDQQSHLLWSSRHGGGAKRIELRCSTTSCDEKFTY